MKPGVIIYALLSLYATATLAGNPASCPFTPAELKIATGMDFNAGKAGAESNLGSGKAMECRYDSKAGSHIYLTVSQTVMNDPSQARGWEMMLAGTKEKIQNDPDGAIRQTDQGDLTSPNLHYARSGDMVQLRVYGIGKKHAAFASLQEKLPSLRRLP
jgi:hypothetical protein